MKYQFFLITFLTFLLVNRTDTVVAQELNAQVTIQTLKLQTVDPKVFKTLENELTEFLNTRKWTNDNFKASERIECSFLITITEELSTSRFKATAAIQSNRPVYNSTYNSLLLNYKDASWEFNYQESDPLEFNESAYLSDLTSLVAFYAYIIIGLDYDSFALNSGNTYFSKAQEIVNNAQSSAIKGWKAFDSPRNRYWLVENLLSTKFKSLRQAYYTYHIEGLDKMYADANASRNKITSSLKLVEKAYNNNTNSMIVPVFLSAKRDEIVNIFDNEKVTPTNKIKAANVMKRIDGSNSKKYSVLTSGLSNQNARAKGFINSKNKGTFPKDFKTKPR